MRQLVIGAGEVGQALAKVLGARLMDYIVSSNVPEDVLHIAFPWSDEFVSEVQRYEAMFSPDLVIVHSTVPVDTCDPHRWVHSPIRGRHPDLVEGIKTFTKHFGGRYPMVNQAAQLFADVGITVQVHACAAMTEAGKLWELVQYGVAIRTAKAISAWCDEQGLDFDQVYTAMADTYNDGYRTLGLERFIRPVLDPTPGPIGGHCVVPGARLLDHPLAALVHEGEPS